MPSFTAFALDRLLEPGTSKSVDKSVARSNPVSKPRDIPKPASASNPNLERTKSVPTLERKVSRPQISPALYATPEVTPLPDSPSSFPPSPYIINHKRRGPRLLKSFSEVDVATCKKAVEEVKDDESAKNEEAKVADRPEARSVTFTIEEERLNGVGDNARKQELANGAQGCPIEEECGNGLQDSEVGSSNSKLGGNGTRNNLPAENDVSTPVASNLEKDKECEVTFDSQKLMSCQDNSYREDSAGVESSVKHAATTPGGEFFDAWDEFSSESGKQPSFHEVEAELSEMRLGLLMEIEKRKQAEEALKGMQSQWQKIRQEMAIVGLRLPAYPVDITEGDQMVDVNPVEELSQQLYLARFVSYSMGRGMAKAEMQIEMKAQIEAKNIEISRLLDRLNYYEAVNREMSQRNQEAVEMARRNRLARKRRQRWVWGSVAAATAIGAAALAWSYVPARGSSSSNGSSALERNDTAT